ncbi:hypothetical protein SEUCBS140593_010668 [Sporothrix eucalyptigena]|uniref:Major facilitator superfamily (MFS) profile domain-containing protein n=1 Tax=Sporothrix eucalyptigena TaxID=1812306 RepID=A0ABP0D234_9PEZI
MEESKESGVVSATVMHMDASSKVNPEVVAATITEKTETVREAIRNHPLAVFWAITMSLTVTMEGYDTNLMGSLLAYPPFVAKFGQYYPAPIDETLISGPWQIGLGQAANCGEVLGLFFTAYLAERVGHRMATISSLAVMGGLIFIAFFAPNIGVLCAGQLLLGIVWGVFSVIGTMYASEVCPLVLRGYLTSFTGVAWTLGSFISSGILQGLVNNTTDWAYRIPFAVQWVWLLPLIGIAFFAPDSPWWLVRQGRLEDAEKSICRLSKNLSPEQAKQRLAVIVHTNNLEQQQMLSQTGKMASYLDCFRGANLVRTEIACVVFAAQSLVGQVFVGSPTYFFVQAGINPSDAYKLGFGASGLAVLGTLFSWVLMTYFGRRPLMIVGFAGMAVLLLSIALLTYHTVDGGTATTTGALWAQSGLALAWLTVYSSLFGSQSLSMAAEVSATRVRSHTLSLARATYMVWAIIDGVIETALLNPTEGNLKGKAGFVWFAFTLLLLVWSLFRVPETKGRTFEELDILFEQKVPLWKFSETEVGVLGEVYGDEKELP